MENRALQLWSAVLSTWATVQFGVMFLAQANPESVNPLSWAMWTTLDMVVVLLTVKAGKNPAIYIGWTLAAAFVTAGAIWVGGVPRFGAAEAVCVTAVIVAVYLWWTNKWGAGLIACALAMFIAGVPQLITMARNPAPDTWWFWATIGLSCILSIRGSGGVVWQPQNYPTISSTLFQMAMLPMLFLPPPLALAVTGILAAATAWKLGSQWAIDTYGPRPPMPLGMRIALVLLLLVATLPTLLVALSPFTLERNDQSVDLMRMYVDGWITALR